MMLLFGRRVAEDNWERDTNPRYDQRDHLAGIDRNVEIEFSSRQLQNLEGDLTGCE